MNITPDGVGLTFYTDKISVVNEQPKYRMISWSFLPAGAQQMLEEYDAQRPREADYFFVREDSTPLVREDFVSLFELCLLHTRWRFLHIMPHALCVGGASNAWLEGATIFYVQFAGRWCKGSAAYEHYKVAYVSMLPEKAYEDLPHCRRVWPDVRLAFLSCNVVQKGVPPGERHMYNVMLQTYFPRQWAVIRATLPAVYPMRHVAFRVLKWHRDWVSGKFINKMKARWQGTVRFVAKRQYLSTLPRRSQLQPGTQHATMKSLREQVMIDPDCMSVGVQTEVQDAVSDCRAVTMMDQQTQVEVMELLLPPPLMEKQDCGAGDMPLEQPTEERSLTSAAMNGGLLLQLEHSTDEEVATQVESIPRHQKCRRVRRSSEQPGTSVEEVQGDTPSVEWFQIRQNMVRQVGTSALAVHQRAGPGGEVSLLKHKRAATPLYKVRQGKFHALITREEFIARNPGRKLPETATATENCSTTQRIRWRLSHLYREHRNTIVERSRAKREGKQLPGLKPLRYTRTMKALVLHFFDRVVRHGHAVVPYIEEEDGQKSDDDFFQRVLKHDVAGDNDGVGVLGTDEHIKTESTEDADPDWSPLNN